MYNRQKHKVRDLAKVNYHSALLIACGSWSEVRHTMPQQISWLSTKHTITTPIYPTTRQTHADESRMLATCILLTLRSVTPCSANAASNTSEKGHCYYSFTWLEGTWLLEGREITNSVNRNTTACSLQQYLCHYCTKRGNKQCASGLPFWSLWPSVMQMCARGYWPGVCVCACVCMCMWA